MWLANKGWFISPVSALTPYSPVGRKVAESTWACAQTYKQTNRSGCTQWPRESGGARLFHRDKASRKRNLPPMCAEEME